MYRQISSFIFLLTSIIAGASYSYAGSTDYRAPEQVPGTKTVSAEEVKALYDTGVVIVDVRNPRLYARRHIPGAHHLDLKHAFNEVSLAAIASKSEPLVIYCSGVKCSRSYRASEKAVSWGYQRVHYFRGGIVDWHNAGYPVKSSK